jgi:uncharacterized protein (DUF849 family)
MSMPRSAAEVGWDARDCAAAGATSVHVHPREPRRESIAPSAVARTVNAIRAAAPGLPIGVPTSAALALDRPQTIKAWDVLPDFAAVDWRDNEAAAIARALVERGVGLEAKLASPGAAMLWAASGLRGHTLRVVVPEAELARPILALVGDGVPAIVYGTGVHCWAGVRYALANGHGIRIGFEDTLELPDGSSPASNEELVRAALALA